MVASGFGIAAQLPYLKRLNHGYNAREFCARRIHLVWQIETKGESAIDAHSVMRLTSAKVGAAGQPLLNGALVEDNLDGECVSCSVCWSLGFLLTWQQILSISIYEPSSDSPEVSSAKRATLYPGTAPLRQLVAEEAAGAYLTWCDPEDVEWDAKTLVGGDQPARDAGLESGIRGTKRRSGKMLVIGRRFSPSAASNTDEPWSIG